MDYRSLHAKTVAELRQIVKTLGLKIPSGTTKASIIDMILSQAETCEKESPAKTVTDLPQKTENVSQEEQPAPAAVQKAEKVFFEQRYDERLTPPQLGERQIGRPQPRPVQPTENRLNGISIPRRNFCESTGRYEKNVQHNQGYWRYEPSERNDLPVTFAFNETPRRREGVYSSEYGITNPGVPDLLASGECFEGEGVLEIVSDGYGFLRMKNYMPGSSDVYVSAAQIRRFLLRTGDMVSGKVRPAREGDKYNAMLYITSVNGAETDVSAKRPAFDMMTPLYPQERLRLECQQQNGDFALRMIDMIAPIGMGQRGLIVSPPKAGKTTLLKKIANSISENYPDVHLIVLLIDERPEDVTDIQRSVKGEVIYSTFEDFPETHTRLAEMVNERARRLVEMGKNVVILMDSITRLVRAYNMVLPPTGRFLTGGLDPGVLYKAKRFFGSARNTENGGSLTVLATAMVDTGNGMDIDAYEEFRSMANMELHLERKPLEKDAFPLINMACSDTHRNDLLMTQEEIEAEFNMRKILFGGNGQDSASRLIGMMKTTQDNREFMAMLKEWVSAN